MYSFRRLEVIEDMCEDTKALCHYSWNRKTSLVTLHRIFEKLAWKI